MTKLEPTKKEIIQRLFEQEHITFNEMWTLLLDEPEVKYVPMPYEKPLTFPYPYPFIYGTSTAGVHQSETGD